jgi:hypothetical protein
MAAKLTRLIHKIAIQFYLVAESYTICSSRSSRAVLNLLDTPPSMFIPQSERPSFASIEYNWQKYSFVYFNL